MNTEFDWTKDRAMSLKALLDARTITDEQAQELKQRLAALVSEYLPSAAGAVKVSIAEEGSRHWAPVGDPCKLIPLFDIDRITGEITGR